MSIAPTGWDLYSQNQTTIAQAGGQQNVTCYRKGNYIVVFLNFSENFEKMPQNHIFGIFVMVQISRASPAPPKFLMFFMGHADADWRREQNFGGPAHGTTQKSW